ncbi:MAG: cation:proton antiporter [Candidatus Bathyarchaeia archaeon]
MHLENLIFLVSATLLISYVSSLVYSRTRIPDIIWLMAFGLTVGPVLGLVNKELFLELAPLMSVLALSIILFEAGINVDVVVLLQTMTKTVVLSVTTILSTIIAVGFVLNYFLPQDFTLLQAMLLGAMIGGTSTVSVFGVLSVLSKTVKNIGSTRVLLTMESIISDPLCIIASITLIKMVMLSSVTVSESIKDIFSIFSLSSLLGIIIGIIWARILGKLRGKSLTYMITLAVLLPSYLISESLIGEGGGAMTALCFGLAISNYKYIAERLGITSKVMIDKHKLREFHEEVTFFIKSFFFVYIGLIVTISAKYALIGVGIVAMLMILRFLNVKIIGSILSFSKEEEALAQVVKPAGLPAFVMSQLPMIFDPGKKYFVSPGIYPDLCMPIVLGTVIYSSLAGPTLAKRALTKEEKEEKPEEKGQKEEEESNEKAHTKRNRTIRLVSSVN